MSMPSPFEVGAAIGGNVAGGIRGAQENTALDQILQQAIQSNDPQVQQDVMRQILTRVSPEKQPAALQILQNRSQQMQQQKQRQSMLQEGYNPDLPEYINKERARGQEAAIKEERGIQRKQIEKTEETKGLSNTLDWLDENIKYTGSTKIPFTASSTLGGARRGVVEKRAEFDASGFWAADNVFTHFNKGTVSSPKLELIRNELAPKSDLPERVNKARIASLRRMANLPANISKDKFDKILDKEVENANKGYEAQDESETGAPTAINPATGERLILREGQWQPLQ